MLTEDAVATAINQHENKGGTATLLLVPSAAAPVMPRARQVQPPSRPAAASVKDVLRNMSNPAAAAASQIVLRVSGH